MVTGMNLEWKVHGCEGSPLNILQNPLWMPLVEKKG